MDTELFYINQQSISLSLMISDNLRKQNFFNGTRGLTCLLKNLNYIAEYVFSNEDYNELSEEMQLILPALLEAQNNQDYILQADILEGDLVPLLQKIQIKFQESDILRIPDFEDINIGVLKEYLPEFFEKFSEACKHDNKNDTRQFEIRMSINGQPTLLVKMPEIFFYMHSSVNPAREAQLLVDSLKKSNRYVVFGLGLGYQVCELLNRYPEADVVVYENSCQILQYAFEYTDWTSYIRDGRLKIVYDADIKRLVGKFCDEGRRDDCELLMHYPTIRAIDDVQVRQLLEDFFVTTSSMREQSGQLDSNFKIISEHNLPECGALKKLFEGRNVVIVGAGPSADDAFDYFKRYRNKLMIFATGHIVRSLIKGGIIPDVIILTDPQPHMYKQIEGLDLGSVPLILLSTGSASILKNYNGPIYVAYQNGYEPAEKMAKSLGATLFETGGSVTTTALDIAIRFGAGKVIFAGIDLAYTGENSHAQGEGRKIESTDGLRKVKSCKGGIVYTSKNLDIYRKWIERRISNEQDLVVYNTGAGADIKGTVWRSWDDIVQMQ